MRKYVLSCDLYDVCLNYQHCSGRTGAEVLVFGKEIESIRIKLELIGNSNNFVDVF